MVNADVKIEDQSNGYKVASLVRLCRILRLSKLFWLSSAYKNDQLKISVKNMTLLLYFIIIFLVYHTVSCLWILIAQLSAKSHAVTWISEKKVTGYSEGSLYLYSFILVVGKYVGFGDVEPTNPIEFVFGIIIMIGGYVSFSYLVSLFIQTMSKQSEKERKFNDDMAVLNQVARERNIPFDLHTKLKQHHHLMKK